MVLNLRSEQLKKPDEVGYLSVTVDQNFTCIRQLQKIKIKVKATFHRKT